MLAFFKRKVSVTQAFIDSTHPAASPGKKLHELLKAVAITRGGFVDRGAIANGNFAAVARRAKLSCELVTQVMQGRIWVDDPRWWAVEALLKAFNASQEQIELALGYYKMLPARPPSLASQRLFNSLPSSRRSPDTVVGPVIWPGPGAVFVQPFMEKPESPSEKPAVKLKITTASPENAEKAEEKPAVKRKVTGSPKNAETPAEFVEELRMYRWLRREPSFRDMAKALEERPEVPRVSYGTLSSVLKNTTKLPSANALIAFIAALGGTQDEIDEWIAGRSRILAESDQNSKPT